MKQQKATEAQSDMFTAEREKAEIASALNKAKSAQNSADNADDLLDAIIYVKEAYSVFKKKNNIAVANILLETITKLAAELSWITPSETAYVSVKTVSATTPQKSPTSDDKGEADKLLAELKKAVGGQK